MIIGLGIGIPFIHNYANLAIVQAFSPADLFANGEPGAWYDPSDLNTLFQDAAGTTPVTAVEQPVGLMLDKSGNGFHATQPDPALAPTYSTDGVLHWLDFGGNGKRYMRFNVAAYGTAPPLSMMGAMALTANGFFPVFLGSESTETGIFFGLGEDGDRRLRLTIAGGTGGTGPIIRGLSAFSIGQPYVVSHIIGETSHSGWIDGVKQSEGLRSGSWGIPNEGRIGNGASVVTTYQRFFGALLLRRSMTTAESNQLGLYFAGKSGASTYSPTDPPAGPVPESALRVYAVGDSTVAPYSGQPSIVSLVETEYSRINVAVPGHSIAQQKSAWLALTINPSEVAWAVMQIGLNDLNPSIGTAASKIAELQDLANTMRSSIGPAPLFASCMLPCRQRLINVYGATNGPLAQQRWLSMNEALAGLGSSPITAVDGRITSHVPLLDDGNGNLAAEYDTGDGIHPNTAGRQIMADAWEAALLASSVTP